MAEESGREEAGAKRSIPQTSQEQEDEITLFFFFLPSILPLFHPSVWKGKDATPPLLPGGCLVWGLVNVCCDSWGSRERPSGQLGLPPPHLLLLSFLNSFTPICHRGLRSGLLVQCEVSLSPAVTPHFINSSPSRRLGGRAPPSLQRSAATGRDPTASLRKCSV